jgi:sulfur carrier protein
MTVLLNGERVELDDGASVADAVAAVGADPERRGLAAAVDGEVVPRRSWHETALLEGQEVEVVQAVQGG